MRLQFIVNGMTCAACSARVEKTAGAVPGVNKAEVNLLRGTLTVHTEDSGISDAVILAVTDAGYPTQTFEKKASKQQEDDSLKTMKFRIISSACFLVVLMYFTMGHMMGLPLPAWYTGTENAMIAVLLQFFLTLPVVLINHAYFTKGFKSLVKRSPNMDSLIAVGSGSALVYGVIAMFIMAYASGHGDTEALKHYRHNLYFESAAMILTLITLGKFLETRAKGKTGDAIRQLMDLRPETAVVHRDGGEETVPVGEVSVNDVVIVRSGSRIPVDGTVIEGRASVDQSALTGESVPADKSVGDTVSAATICTEGFLKVKADKVGEDTVLSQVIRLVEEAGGSKAPIARLADKIAGIFVPVVMLISAITFAVWLVAGNGLEFALTSAIAVLVISCPCALGLATPVAIMVATGRGAQLGVLFKNAEALENLHNIDTVVLDKTGTLTRGKPAVTDVIVGNSDNNTLLTIAASLECRSEHPFAKAIMEYVGDICFSEPEMFEVLPGSGVCGIVNGTKFYGGNAKLMSSLGITVPMHTHLAAEGKTPLYFAAENGNYLGAIAAADVLKDDSSEAVAALRKIGLSVIMLTGDNETTAKAIADKAGIERVISDVLPGDKAGTIQQLRAEGRKVLMVGDGINDAPALVTADVGMAIGNGTDIAIESADVVLMKPSLSGVVSAVSLSKATVKNIRQNLFWAFFYNILGIPVAAGVLYPAFGIQLSPMIGSAAMSMSSVFVVTNALRLRFFKPTVIKQNKKTEIQKEEIKMETVIKVNGMMCPHCKARVEKVCQEVAGTESAVVDLQEKIVTVTGAADVDALKKAIIDAGYEVVE